MLHVWLRAQHSTLAVWHESTQHWQTVDGWQQLQTLYGNYKSSKNQALCLYFPSSHALQVDTALTTTQLKQLGESGKQYLFEETSLTPIEQLLIRQSSQADSTQLYAIAQSDVTAWQQSAQLVGMTVTAMLPDFLLLPSPEEGAGQQVTLYQDDQTMLLRQSPRQGMAVSYLPLVFDRFPHLTEVITLSPITAAIHDTSSSPNDAIDRDVETHATEISGMADVSGTTDVSDTTTAATASTTNHLIAQTAALITEHQLLLTHSSKAPTPVDSPERHVLNFFTKSTDTQLSPYLRVAMMVALSALVLQIATDAVQWYKYDNAAAATEAEIATQYQSWFADEPLSTRTKLQVQMQPKLRRDSQMQDTHIAALTRISPLIKQSSLRAQALVMQPSVLSFTLIAPDRGSLDKFASTLVSQGLNAKLEQVNGNKQGQFSGKVTVNVANPVDSASAS